MAAADQDKSKIAGTAALGKAISLLTLIADARQPLRFADLLETADLPKATLHRLVSALIDHGLLRVDERDRTYRLGLRLLEFAHKAWSEFDLRGAAEPEMLRLREVTGETVQLAILDAANAVIIDQVESSQAVKLVTSIGRRLPLATTALGKAILAFLHPAEQRDIVAAITGDPTCPELLRLDLSNRLKLTRAAGYAVEFEDFNEGVSGVASPILDPRGRAIAAIGLSGPSFRLDRRRLHELGPQVIESARRTTHNAGGSFISISPLPAPNIVSTHVVQCPVPATAFLGEGPLWSSRERMLYWVDILAPALYCFDPATGHNETFPMPTLIGSLALTRTGDVLVALQNGLHLFDRRSGSLTLLAHPEIDRPDNRFNDGKTDRAGRFWVGTMDTSPQPGSGSLYRVTADGACARMDTGFFVSNGIAWSPDNRTLYFVDSGRKAIFRYDFDLAAGTVANRQVFAEIPDDSGSPDGITVDAEGHVWCALWDGWAIRRFDPQGRVSNTITLPVPRPTSLAFGGPDLSDLYITTARIRLSSSVLAEAPLSGSVLMVKPGVVGLPEPLFG
jgi:sugar lactone lactonase YvrE/DNA-binding IclR family transcriptional regulator